MPNFLMLPHWTVVKSSIAISRKTNDNDSDQAERYRPSLAETARLPWKGAEEATKILQLPLVEQQNKHATNVALAFEQASVGLVSECLGKSFLRRR